MFRVGILYRVQDFLELVYKNEITTEDFFRGFRSYGGIPGDIVFEVATKFCWVRIINGIIQPIDNGLKIIKEDAPYKKLRLQLKDIILIESPPWLPIIKWGRKKLMSYVSLDTLQCFREALLTESVDPETIAWWDQFQTKLFSKEESEFLEIGRQGEALSYDYETKRTGISPKWVSIDDNSLGYDILSQVSRTNNEKMVIEVKTSEKKWDTASFFLTSKEWLILNTQKNATIHLWSIGFKPYYFQKISIDEIKMHVPHNYGKGEWQIVNIPFSCWKPISENSLF